MENYLFVNGKKIPLAEEQIKMTAFAAAIPLSSEQMQAAGLLGARSALEISKIIQSGEAREHFQPGEVVNINGIEAEVIGFNHDKSEHSPSRPTVTFMMRQVAGKRPFHDGECPDGWIGSDLRSWMNNEFFFTLPEELRTAILSVKRITRNHEGRTFESADKLFVPTESEMFGSAIWSDHEDGERYEAFGTSESRVLVDEDGEDCPFWCCSSSAGSSGNICCVISDGYPTSDGAAATWVGAPVCFCL